MQSLRNLVTGNRLSPWHWALVLILIVTTIGVVGFMAIVPGLTFLDAFYSTVVILSTVGLKDRPSEVYHQQLMDHPEIGKQIQIFTIIMVVFGIASVAYASSVFIRSLVEGELREAIGLQRTKRRLNFMKDHYIICGYGRMGETIADILHNDGHSVVVIEANPGLRLSIEEKGMTCIVGDATDEHFLKMAVVEKARGLLAVASNDPENLFITMSARQLNPKIVIVTRALSPNVEQKFRRAGADRVIQPYKIGAHQLAQAALRPTVVDFIEIASRTSNYDIEIEEIQVGAGSKLSGKPLKEAGILRQLGLIIIGVRPESSQHLEFNPSADTVIHAGDTLVALGKSTGLKDIRPYFE
ncbi:MAG TPA: potassium channel protein [Candidatus Sumerlaeota bacterium]|nr:potassium channel protein [Candidatus Sumerlaeota bacterium]HPS00110.1 potassium channel protein [Candidatus Sumerlaeota bacterium]